jgi:hypothetical protein
MLVAIVLAATFSLQASGATISSEWRARIGPAGNNGSVILRSYTNGTGLLAVSLHRFRPSTTLVVAVYHGTCRQLHSRVVRLPSVRSSRYGTGSRRIGLTTTQVTLITRAARLGHIALRVGTGSFAHCGNFVRSTTLPSPTPTPSPTPRPTPTPTPRPTPTPTPSSCSPTDQDRYVYDPSRLKVLQACLYVTGTVVSTTHEPDGDVHIRLRLDAPNVKYLTQANYDYQNGTLVVEPVCVTSGDAICNSDPDPLTVLPSDGAHVWMEGRYVLDLQHNSWAELHPLYRWGHL